MNSKLTRALRIPSLLLAAALQILPIARTAAPATGTATHLFAIIYRWAAGAAATLGGIQAVAGASTAITNPLNVNATNGQPFSLRLTTAPDQAHYWTASGLPTGLTLSGTSGQTLWRIVGTPTATGTYRVGLLAKDQSTSSGSRTVSATLTINVLAPITILAPPTIAIPPASRTVAEGGSANFTVTATGTAPLSYQWRFQGNPLAGQTSTSLTVNPATTATAGNYDVVITNIAGSVTSPVASLTVIVPPAIVSPPSALTLTQGQNATFNVAATGTVPLRYFWRRDSTVVGVTPNSSWTVTNVQPADAGTYSVVVSNFAGTATSSGAALTVIPTPQPPFISSSPTNRSVVIGSPTTFTVIAGGTVPLQYQWYFNNAPLAGKTSPSCTLPAVQSSDLGQYFVVVTNFLGSVTSAVASLSQIAPPQILGSPQSLTRPAGGSATFTVTTASAAAVGYQWRKGGVNVANTARIAGAQSDSLSITALQTNDSGNYLVIVTNVAGAVTSQVAVLTVTAPAPAPVAKGTYSGLFYESDGARHYSSGSFKTTITAGRQFTATAVAAGVKYVWSGRFNTSWHATNIVKRAAPLHALRFELEVDPADSDQLRGIVTDGTWSAPLLADRAVFNATNNPAPQSGRYTVAISGALGAIDFPEGDGICTATVSASGYMTLAGTLADGVKITRAARVSKSGQWPCYVPLYSRTGMLLSWQTFESRPGDDVHGKVIWIRGQLPLAKHYPLGFDVATDAMGSLYVPPATGVPAWSITPAHYELAGGNLAQDVGGALVSRTSTLMGGADANKLTLLLTPKSGLFTGSFVNLATGNIIPCSGVLLQKQNSGHGFFLGPTRSGHVLISP